MELLRLLHDPGMLPHNVLEEGYHLPFNGLAKGG
jgi:hypothetical protein